MSLYERIDRHPAPRPKDNLEYVAVFAVCFFVFLLPVALRRLRPGSRHRTKGLSIFRETSEMATNCAALSFMGM